MKKFVFSVFLLLFVAVLLCQSIFAAPSADAETVSEMIRKAAPTEFGYLDNTEYYMQYYFSSLSYVDDSCIVTCTESTNFNEFGVFHVKNPSDAKLCEKQLKAYLANAKERFKNGVVYDINEYPKFENAKVTVIGQYVIYTILDASQTKAATGAVRQYLQ